ncbi:MAG: alpha/beta fold hydrolase [Aureispira sp.]
MATLYCVPGLGTDERIFSKLIPLLTPHETVVLNFIEPLNYQEPLAEYAKRLAEKITSPKDEPIFLIGFSLGGPIALEIAKLYPNVTLILISTFKQKKETPIAFKMARVLPLHRLVPTWYTHQLIPRLAPLLKISSKEDGLLLGKMFRAKPASHFAWGRQAIVDWENEVLPTTCWHINGNKDHIFNSALPHVDHCINGGTHNMILDRAEEIATWMLPLLTKHSK